MSADTRSSAFLRAELARNAGIFLDERRPAAIAVDKPATTDEPDREEIRAILVEHAPAHQLDWLVASCPSVAHALTYQRPSNRRKIL